MQESWISLVSDGDGTSPSSVLDSPMCELLMMADPRVLGLSSADRTQFEGFVCESHRKIHIYMVKPRRDAMRRTDPYWSFATRCVDLVHSVVNFFVFRVFL